MDAEIPPAGAGDNIIYVNRFATKARGYLLNFPEFHNGLVVGRRG